MTVAHLAMIEQVVIELLRHALPAESLPHVARRIGERLGIDPAEVLVRIGEPAHDSPDAPLN